MPRAVGRAGAAVGLPALAKVQGLAAKGALVDLAVLGAGEGQAVVLQLDDRLGGLPVWSAGVCVCVQGGAR